MSDNKQKELNQIKEDLFALYPNAKSISVMVNGDKIKVTPHEEYTVFDTEEE